MPLDIPKERKKLDRHLLKANLMLAGGVCAVVIACGDLWGWHGVALSLGTIFALGGIALSKINIEAKLALDDLERLQSK